MALKELLVAFGVEVDAKDLVGVEGKISNLMGGIKKLGTVLLGGAAVKGVASFIANQVDMADQINDTANRLGVAAEDLQRFEYAAKRSGIESQAAAQSLNIFNKNIGEAAGGNKGAADAFAALGVSVKDANGNVGSTLGLLDGVAEGLKDLHSPQERAAALMKLFGKQGAALAPMLEGGAAGLQELYDGLEKTGGLLDQGYLDSVAKAGDAMDDFHYATRGAKAALTAALLPAFTWLVKEGSHLIGMFTRLAKETDGVKHIIEILGVAAGGFLILKLNNLIKTAGGVSKALKSAFGLGFKEMLIIGSLILIGLLIEDIITWVQGGDSVVGGFFEKFMGHDEAIAFAQQLRDIWAQLETAFTTIGPLLGNVMTQLGPVFASALPYLVKGLEVVIKLVASAVAGFAGLVGAIGAVASGKGLDGAMKAINGAGEAIMGKTVSTVDAKTGAVNTRNVGGLFGEAPPPAAAPPGFGNGQIGPPVNVTQQIAPVINVNGAQDPMATADAVAQKQSRVNTQANRDAMGALKVTGP